MTIKNKNDNIKKGFYSLTGQGKFDGNLFCLLVGRQVFFGPP